VQARSIMFSTTAFLAALLAASIAVCDGLVPALSPSLLVSYPHPDSSLPGSRAAIAPAGTRGMTDSWKSGGAHQIRRKSSQPLLSNLKRGHVTCADRSDCTEEVQKNLDDDSVDHVILKGLYNVEQLRWTRSGMTLELRPGTVLQARRGFYCPNLRACPQLKQAFRSLSVIRMYNVSNARIIGDGAAIRMWRVDYSNDSLYNHSEFRAGLEISVCLYFTVRVLSIGYLCF
jgi:hypothetical protein